jgi:hypothetical protein
MSTKLNYYSHAQLSLEEWLPRHRSWSRARVAKIATALKEAGNVLAVHYPVEGRHLKDLARAFRESVRKIPEA